MALALAGAVVWLAVASTTVSADLAGIAPGGEGAVFGGDAGLDFLVAVLALPEGQAAAAMAVQAILAASPLVASVTAGPGAFEPVALDWLWQRRFAVAPPPPERFVPAAMAERLLEARAALATAEGAALGDRMLRDPTGAFAAAVDELRARRPAGLGPGGVWTSVDGRAALVFGRLLPEAGSGDDLVALAQAARAAAADHGARALVAGPRLIGAEIGRGVEQRSLTAAGIAVILLLLWLTWSLRSGLALVSAFAPVAAGLAAGALAVQLVFGHVHVIALGFGGALTGLAIDYPLHLTTHGREGAARVRRAVAIGAVTTAVAFLALLGSGVPALQQTGLFVAAGILVAAGLALASPPVGAAAVRTFAMERLSWHLPRRRLVEAALALVGVAAMLGAPVGAPRAVATPPPAVTEMLAEMNELVPAPSARWSVVSRGATEAEVLARQRLALPALESAVEAEELGRFEAMADIVRPAPAELPPPAEFGDAAQTALAMVGLDPGFAPRLQADYAEALAAALERPDLGPLAQLAPLPQRQGQGWSLSVRLYDVKDAGALAARLEAGGGARLVDNTAETMGRLAALSGAALHWLVVGAAGAAAVLLLLLRPRRSALGVALTVAGALGATVCVLRLAGVEFDVFRIVALTLVVGIGVDYGVLVQPSRGSAERARALRSVGLCATSTAIPFAVMAASPEPILSEIGATVLVGLGAMAILTFARSHSEPAENLVRDC
ncbi:MAG: MMPL family transporter [Pseudomonadota bacterium]